MWKLPDEDLEALIRDFESSDWREMRLQMEGVELILAKGAAPQLREIPPGNSNWNASRIEPTTVRKESSGAPLPAPKKLLETVPQGWTQIRAPSLGTFYRSPKPGTPPFVEVGSNIGAETEICLIEVMKLFTTVRAGVKGTVREIYPADSDLVEYNQPLFLVEP
ncbi:MAG: acetyl-CoA carboxylase biotin carboxyl carrier protein [Gammaproteobacteria bacterium]|jgi:acetyl-CoA carboxylase biotin carboxyl carrier protein|nr:acetyl-CoA carboxylase biotin carboxyl carrier protein [Gammaproteobacteria bacterium]